MAALTQYRVLQTGPHGYLVQRAIEEHGREFWRPWRRTLRLRWVGACHPVPTPPSPSLEAALDYVQQLRTYPRVAKYPA